jgi:thymidylate synthase ThyX
MEVVFPRIVLAEFNTHRMLSRNSASSRAIPVEKMIKSVLENPYVPIHWGKNQKGMQAEEEFTGNDAKLLELEWRQAAHQAVKSAEKFLQLGVHKQITNRLLEPFLWHTVVVTATDWDNFFHLRNHPAAHPEIHRVAELMQYEYENHVPTPKEQDEYHIPYIQEDEDFPVEKAVKISVARCARVSYLTHDGKRDPKEDLVLHNRLLSSGHLSPFEHVAKPHKIRPLYTYYSGNFRGWLQYRKTLPYEQDILGPR